MAKSDTKALYATVIDNVAKLLTAVKEEAKANKKLSNGVARLERLAKTLPVFASKYEKVVAAAAKKAEEPAAEKPAKKAAKKAVAKKAAKKTKAKAKPTAEAAPKPAKPKKTKAAAPPAEAAGDEPPADATIQ